MVILDATFTLIVLMALWLTQICLFILTLAIIKGKKGNIPDAAAIVMIISVFLTLAAMFTIRALGEVSPDTVEIVQTLTQTEPDDVCKVIRVSPVHGTSGDDVLECDFTVEVVFKKEE
jgi:hypothetical protein